MLPKKNRVAKKAVEKIFKTGRSLTSPGLTFKYILDSRLITPSISFIVPKSIAKKAVDRNRLRRLGYSVLEKQIKRFPAGLTGVFVFKKYLENLPIIKNEIEIIFNKIN